jgi:hypothetical protein
LGYNDSLKEFWGIVTKKYINNQKKKKNQMPTTCGEPISTQFLETMGGTPQFRGEKPAV